MTYLGFEPGSVQRSEQHAYHNEEVNLNCFFARTCGLRRIYTPEIKKRKKEIKKSKQERKKAGRGNRTRLTGSQNTHADHNKSQLTLLFVARCLQLRGIYTPGATGNAEKNRTRRTRTQVDSNPGAW